MSTLELLLVVLLIVWLLGYGGFRGRYGTKVWWDPLGLIVLVLLVVLLFSLLTGVMRLA